GVELPFTEAEVAICEYARAGARAQLAFVSGECVGFLVYHLFAECILYVVHEYIRPDHKGKRLAHRLVSSLGKPIKKIIFKTIEKNPDDRIHVITGNYRTKIAQFDDLTVWEMPWGG
ncbi:MAG: hypothetical protein R3204_16835, partial [Oceanospirillum sp.]|nr:hypothetical protein [Oceanospirillum sp.]